jgi:hypothetical protein
MHRLTLQAHPLVKIFDTTPLHLSFFEREELTDAQPHEHDTTLYKNHQRNNILAKWVFIDKESGKEIPPAAAYVILQKRRQLISTFD